jgi:MFS family permease
LVDGGVVHADQWQVYLPVMLVAFACMVPFIVVAEKKQKMKQVLLFAVLLLLVGIILLGLELKSVAGITFALWVFFVAFNILEASLPSLVSKFAPAGFKGSAMGVYSTCQFLGAFVGGILGGFLSEYYSLSAVFIGVIPLLLIWAVLVWTMDTPRHLSSYRIALSAQSQENEKLESELLCLPGVHEVVIMLKDQAAYLKIDTKVFDPIKLKQINI